MYEALSFHSYRLIALLTHFILTSFCIWTRFDSVGVSLKPNASKQDFKDSEEEYMGIVGFGLTVLVFRFVTYSLSYYHLTLAAVFNLVMDTIASFFLAWMVLDALDWRNYTYILGFCVLLPAIGDIAKYLLFLRKNLWVNWKSSPTFDETSIRLYEYSWALVTFFYRLATDTISGFFASTTETSDMPPSSGPPATTADAGASGSASSGGAEGAPLRRRRRSGQDSDSDAGSNAGAADADTDPTAAAPSDAVEPSAGAGGSSDNASAGAPRVARRNQRRKRTVDEDEDDETEGGGGGGAEADNDDNFMGT